MNSIQGARRVPKGIQGWGQAWTDVANRGHDGVCGERGGRHVIRIKQGGRKGMGVG